jgi:hypothetical protein
MTSNTSLTTRRISLVASVAVFGKAALVAISGKHVTNVGCARGAFKVA